MKKVIYIIITAAVLIACSKEEKKTPKTLEEFNKALIEKKQELNILEGEIKVLTDKIAELDPSLQEKITLVDTSMIRPTAFTRYINIQGAVEAEEPVNAVSEIGGRINRLSVKEGDYVKKGQRIGSIDMESIKKQVAEINTSLDLAKDLYQRQERLWNQKIGSEVQYLQAKNNVDRLEKSLETINFQLTKSAIYAPISGTVDMVITKRGEVVVPGMAIVQILNTKNLKITTDLPENYLKIVKKGQGVDLSFPSIDVETSGKITLLGRKIDPANRTLELEIKPKVTNSLLRPNLLAGIKIIELSEKNVLMMPLEYILQEVDGTEFIYVTTLDDEGKYRAKKRYVSLGEADKGQTIITEGIEAGDAVIFRGSRNVSDGELIEFANR